MLPAELFPDNLPREFVLYRGWQVINEDGSREKDKQFIDSEGPFKIIPDPLGHGNWHTLNNLLDNNGKKMLPKAIREIKYYQEGYYLLYDNNEDELINRGDVKGGFLTKDYVEHMNVMRNNGTLLFDEWVLRIIPEIGCFRVYYSPNQWSWVKLSGEIIEQTRMKFNCVLVSHGDFYCIHNSFGDRVSEKYSSVMFCFGKLWHVNIYSKGRHVTLLHGHGKGEIIDYAQMILIKNNIVALLEKDNRWYSFDSLGNLKECFSWNPELAMK